MSDLRDDIEKYLRGELTPSEMHALEKKALSDPFLADALEGASEVGQKEFSDDLDAINRRIHKKKIVIFTPLRIAAGIIVVIGVSLFVVLRPGEEQEQLAQQKVAADSVTVENKSGPAPEEKKDELLTLAEEPKATKPEEAQPALRSAPATSGFFKADSTTQDTDRSPAIEKEKETEAARDETKTTHISGTVTSAEDGLPLPGVTVVVKGENTGTVTDLNGNYTLDVPDSTALVFSFVGLHTNEVRAKKNERADVKMTEDVSQLSEVVITRAPLPKSETETPVVKLAEPVGGLRAYDKYLEDNKNYPQQALDNDVKGRVVVGFDVGIHGELDNFVVIRSLGYGCDDEVIRLVKEGPQWNPTTEDDKPVESTIHVKMRFDAVKFKKKR